MVFLFLLRPGRALFRLKVRLLIGLFGAFFFWTRSLARVLAACRGQSLTFHKNHELRRDSQPELFSCYLTLEVLLVLVLLFWGVLLVFVLLGGGIHPLTIGGTLEALGFATGFGVSYGMIDLSSVSNVTGSLLQGGKQIFRTQDAELFERARRRLFWGGVLLATFLVGVGIWRIAVRVL
ncbi:MAG: hypothetical protein KDD64_16340 [Bdellovibrionales bacterium]|nr:hypothetical protein [Bdellovibrionales bacterium]